MSANVLTCCMACSHGKEKSGQANNDCQKEVTPRSWRWIWHIASLMIGVWVVCWTEKEASTWHAKPYAPSTFKEKWTILRTGQEKHFASCKEKPLPTSGLSRKKGEISVKKSHKFESVFGPRLQRGTRGRDRGAAPFMWHSFLKHGRGDAIYWQIFGCKKLTTKCVVSLLNTIKTYGGQFLSQKCAIGNYFPFSILNMVEIM